MTEDSATGPAPATAGEHAPAESPGVRDWTAWASLWQVPTIVLSLALIVSGVYVAMLRGPADDFDAAFDDVDAMLAMGQLDAAAARLRDVIEPNLERATDVQRGRFHATVADWRYAHGRAAGVGAPEGSRQVCDEYAQARALGFELSPARLERWAHASIDLGDLAAARRRADELETLSLVPDDSRGPSGAAHGPSPGVRERRNRVLRRLVELSMRRPDLAYDELAAVLGAYRADRLLDADDELWAIARQAELRLEDGLFREAVDHLLVDMRRLEQKAGAGMSFAELDTLLGRGYASLGEASTARFHLERALRGFATSVPARGDALVRLGRLDLADGEAHSALERLDEAVREYAGTPSYLAALLGRAEAFAVLGEHERSLEDYRQVQALLPEAGPRRDVTAPGVASALIDRFLGALVRGELDLGLEYLTIGEALFAPDAVPPELLRHLATVHRQKADNLSGRGRDWQWDDPARIDPGPGAAGIAPEARLQAVEHYRRAGEYATRHARIVVGVAEAGAAWAESMRLAAESFDLAGRVPDAIRYYDEYAAHRPGTDQFRPTALLRLAHAYQADRRFDEALAVYEQLNDEYGSLPQATASWVPMARTLVSLGREPEAEQLLRRVLERTDVVDPQAMDYRDALIELGRLHAAQGKHVPAMERLGEALERYPDDPRADEVRFRLAEATRAQALELRRRAEAEPTAPPFQRQAWRQQADGFFADAQRLYGATVERLGRVEPERLSRLQADMLRYAYLYRADCAFERGELQEAIGLYEQAERRYRDHYAALNALVQIVNCYRALGRDDEALEAHRQALFRLEKLPDVAFRAPEALMDRAAWERWLRNTPPGAVHAASATP